VNVQEECFIAGDHRLAINIDDIYFLGGLPHRSKEIIFLFHRHGGETNATYLIQNCIDGASLTNGRIDIKTICEIPFKAIRFTAAQLCRSAQLHVLTKT